METMELKMKIIKKTITIKITNYLQMKYIIIMIRKFLKSIDIIIINIILKQKKKKAMTIITIYVKTIWF